MILPRHHLNDYNPLLTCTFSPIFSFPSSTYHLLTYCILYQFSDMLELSPSRMYSPSGQCMVFIFAQCSTSCPFSSVTCLSPFQVLGESCITLWIVVEGSFPEHATLYLLLCPGHLVNPWGQRMWYACLVMEWSGNSQSQLVSLGGLWALMTSQCSLWAFSQWMLVHCWVFGWMATCSLSAGFSAEHIGDALQEPGW